MCPLLVIFIYELTVIMLLFMNKSFKTLLISFWLTAVKMSWQSIESPPHYPQNVCIAKNIDLRILLAILHCCTLRLTYSVKQPIIQTFFIDLAVRQRHTCHLALWRNQWFVCHEYGDKIMTSRWTALSLSVGSQGYMFSSRH